MRKPNLLVLGASGGVANAFLHNLSHHRGLFGKIILVDKRENVLSDPYLEHKILDYSFIKKEIKFPKYKAWYFELLKKYNISIVLDITDMDSIPILEATNKTGVNYINTAMNDDKKTVSELVFDVYSRKKELNKGVHILCTGMNPGAVNMWVRYGIEKFGIPKEIIHFEYDTSKMIKNFHDMTTWSIHEFLVENVRDPSGVMLGKGKAKKILPNAVENRVNMKPILEPIMKIRDYPEGFLVLHEENISIAQKYNVPSKFIYAINIPTMKDLIKRYEKKGNVFRNDLMLGDNLTHILEGSDNIGVMLDYKDKRVYYYNSVQNMSVIGTSATYFQVSIGIFAALFSVMFDKLNRGIYFIEDLFDNHYKYYLFDNMRVQEFIFNKHNGKLRLKNYNPQIKLKRKDNFEHLFI